MATPVVAGTRLSGEHHFFSGMAVAVLVVVVVGFARSFFLRPLFPDWPSPSESIFYVHGAVFSLWLILLIAQVSLVASDRRDVHRRVGPWVRGLRS